MSKAQHPDASPRKLPKKKSSTYSSCMLYSGKEAYEKLDGIVIATCNPSVEEEDRTVDCVDSDIATSDTSIEFGHGHKKEHVVSDKMSCTHCSADFIARQDQRDHYKSDWHRYNLKLRLKGSKTVSEDDFEKIAGDVSSISGSEDESETDSDVSSNKLRSKPIPIPQHLRGASAQSGTDSESEGGVTIEGTARKYPKVYFKNKTGELVSVYRCLLYHKKRPPTTQAELLSVAGDLPKKTRWAVCMTAGGHFAGAVFDGENLVAHKTFHRYVVRAKRGSAQSSRDGQGNAPKSAGASLRRYNEAALTQDVQDLLGSWSEELKKCDLIFLRAPSFNRQMFYGGKTPPFRKDDARVRTIPFATRRPTLNEVRRVYQMLASVECYGEAAEITDFIPLSPMRRYSSETGQLEIVSEDALRRSPRRLKEKEGGVTQLASSPKLTSGSPNNKQTGKLILPDYLLADDNVTSSATSTASEADLVEMEEAISTLDLKEYDDSLTKSQRKRHKRKRRPSKHQIEPESDVYAEEKYHLRNALYTACKVGDKNSLKSLLAVLNNPISAMETPLSEANRIGDGLSLDSFTHKNDDDDQSASTSTVPTISLNDDELIIVKDTKIDQPESHKNFGYNSDVGKTEYPGDINMSKGSADSQGIRLLNQSERESTEAPKVSNTGETGFESIKDSSNSSVKVIAVTKPGELPGLVPLENAAQQNLELSPLVIVDILNEPFGDNGTTLLHVTSKAGHRSLVRLLLKAGADPSTKDKFGKVPYTVASDKETRNEFRRFMGEHPDKYDYSKAQISSALTADMEAEKKAKDAEKKKQQKKAKQERLKEKKAEKAKTDAEEREKQRYLALSDREKRALAAERRLVQQCENTGSSTPTLSRCWQCGSDMTGKVPFEYCDFKFCTSKCLQAHRKAAKS